MRRLMTAVAAIALVAGTAHAQGNSGGGGGNRGGGHQAEHGGGGGKPDRAGRGQGGGGAQAVGAPREGGGSKDRGNAGRSQGGAGNDREARGNGGQGGGNDRAARDNGNRGGGNERAARGNGNRGGMAVGAPREGGGGRDRGNVGRGGGPGNDNRFAGNDRGRGHDREIVGRWHDVDVVRFNTFASVPRRGLIAGCPPGLAKKHNGCRPPGQARHWHYDRPGFWGLRLDDGRYWYDDGYLVRLGPDGRIGGFVPLLGGALAIGNVWPTFYEPVAVPVYYESYYGLGQYDAYRYADNVIYRVDPETAAITSVAALLTGDDFVVGNPMPVGYDVYNVPYPYRAQYYDRPDALYRYSDGYIYQLDPETRLIAAAIELIAS